MRGRDRDRPDATGDVTDSLVIGWYRDRRETPVRELVAGAARSRVLDGDRGAVQPLGQQRQRLRHPGHDDDVVRLGPHAPRPRQPPRQRRPQRRGAARGRRNQARRRSPWTAPPVPHATTPFAEIQLDPERRVTDLSRHFLSSRAEPPRAHVRGRARRPAARALRWARSSPDRRCGCLAGPRGRAPWFPRRACRRSGPRR
jgi:hypothetical protein